MTDMLMCSRAFVCWLGLCLDCVMVAGWGQVTAISDLVLGHASRTVARLPGVRPHLILCAKLQGVTHFFSRPHCLLPFCALLRYYACFMWLLGLCVLDSEGNRGLYLMGFVWVPWGCLSSVHCHTMAHTMVRCASCCVRCALHALRFVMCALCIP